VASRIIMARLGQDMEQGRIVEWLKQEGDAVAEGEPLVVIESEKAEIELPAPASGILRRVLVGVGAEVPVGRLIGILAGADEPIDDLEAAASDAAPAAAGGQPAGPTQPPAAAGERPESIRADAHRGKRKPTSPAARRVAQELGVDVNLVPGTGPDGLVTEADVQAHAATMQTEAIADDDVLEVIPLEGIRRRIAERLSLSRQTAADVTTVVDVDMSAIADLRKGTGVSYTAYVLAATARSLREFPILNASLVDNRIVVKRGIHLGVAVAADQGLVVPVIGSADGKTAAEISLEMDDLAARARRGELGPADLRGSTFTVTNSGAFGSLLFTPIINQPEVAILGMGKIVDTPVVREGTIVIRKVMFLCLSYDHRVVDGEPAVRFLQAVKSRLEQPGGEAM
jgi:pyruvate dehydrogenase E2 component (dihydrolipoamide acetyltransferase)